MATAAGPAQWVDPKSTKKEDDYYLDALKVGLFALEKALILAVDANDKAAVDVMFKCAGTAFATALYCLKHGKKYATENDPDIDDMEKVLKLLLNK